MWIKWKYNDHGHPDFKELEVPDDLDGEPSVEDYICERGLVPTWSERFMASRIKWDRIEIPSRQHLENLIGSLRDSRRYSLKKIREYRKLLEKTS